MHIGRHARQKSTTLTIGGWVTDANFCHKIIAGIGQIEFGDRPRVVLLAALDKAFDASPVGVNGVGLAGVLGDG